MKRVTGVVFAIGLVVSLTTFANAQGRPGGQGGRRGGGPPPAPTITTLAGDVLADWQGQKEQFVGLADAMPADKYDYKSTPAQRSFGEQVMHVVQVNGFLYGTLGAKTPAPAINQMAKTKDEVMTALRQSMDYGEAIVKEFSDAQLNERVAPPPFMGPQASRLRLIYGSMQHTQDIYGQMVVYVRLNGIVPPASRRGGL
jgi:uncharacterized damage-inducible protein DinB